MLTENLPAIKKELNIVDDPKTVGKVDHRLIRSKVFIRIIEKRISVDYFQ